MAYLKLLLTLLFIGALFLLGLENVQERVQVDLRPIAQYHNVSLAVVLFYAFFAGVLTYAVVSVVRELQFRSEIARLARERRRLLDELHALRSATLDDLPDDEEVESYR